MQTANAIIIQPVKESKKCPAIKTTTSFLKQIIKNNKRKAVAPHWVPNVFSNLVGSFYEKAETIQEFWKIIKQCNRLADYSTNKRAFTREQEIAIGTKAFKEFAMKVKNGVKMYKEQFAYFNGIVNKQ